MALRRLLTPAEVAAALPGDRLLAQRSASESARVYVADEHPGAVALIRPEPGDSTVGATVLGDSLAVWPLALTLAEGEAVAWVNVPTHTTAPITGARRIGAPWSWMWTTTPPPQQPGEADVVAVPEAAVHTFLQAHYPDPRRAPGHPLLAGWVGVWDPGSTTGADGADGAGGGGSGTLGACATWEWPSPEHAFLSTIVTAAPLRGRGLGAAVTAALTRRLFVGGAASVALGVYCDNAGAIRLYERLGFAAAWHLQTWVLPRRR